MSEAMDAFRTELAGLRARYVQTLPASVAQLRQAWADCRPAPSQRLALQAAHRLAHRIASAGATFGLREVARAARDLENLLLRLVDSEAEPDNAACESIARQLDAVGAEIERVLSEVPDSEGVPDSR